ncbi:5'-3'-deoxyribonucleotidase [Arachidicoccus ginsenosidivorans]|uniref:5'(3')-deoxyribonucleotidase n=1 Tax=Arachidicoccus ginsenosidivorans TaxID=496057 RepID=A0A5B8VHR3_9BACT|nr:5'(3')-deoxyribonucleotidase [Arachidicoccus ginsenosidivorans]QEC70829.1 5'(3')-deoxyribonucleotidase [Arachidicoccus ginsenosidivorans]
MNQTQNKRKTIAIDMDGVLANVEPQLVKYYNKYYGASLTLETIQGMSGAEAFPKDAPTRYMLNQPGFFRDLEVMPGAIDAVRQLMKDYEVYVVSAATEFPLSLFEKYEWLREHFPFIDWRHIVLCGDKSIISTDYMIDDYCKNLDVFKGKTLMFHAYHNTTLHHHFRVRSWSEVVDWFEIEKKQDNPMKADAKDA